MTLSSQSSSQFSSQHAFTVFCEDRWQVYYRLKELDINAQCQGYCPLKVSIQTATEAMQLWSIAKRVSSPRAELAATLEKRWREPSYIDHPLEEKH